MSAVLSIWAVGDLVSGGAHSEQVITLAHCNECHGKDHPIIGGPHECHERQDDV